MLIFHLARFQKFSSSHDGEPQHSKAFEIIEANKLHHNIAWREAAFSCFSRSAVAVRWFLEKLAKKEIDFSDRLPLVDAS